MRHYPDRPAPQPPSSTPSTQLSPSSTDDMNATLLKANGGRNGEPMKRELFGNFKGFSLKPLPMSKPNIAAASNVAYVHPVTKKPDETKTEHCVPIRAAPLPPPNSPLKKSQTKSSPKLSSQSFRYQNINATATSPPETPIEVKLFASKSDAKERPKISHPVLENSTCSVKELIGASNSTQNIYKETKPSTTNTIQKPNEIHSPLKKLPMDKGSLKNLEISAPMKTVTFGRSQSMRSPTAEKPQTKKSNLASGSMRQGVGVKRQMSIVDRPKNPPPPRPLNPIKAQSEQFYANIGPESNGRSQESINDSTDNIYCVIEDVKRSTDVSPPNGLLSEIVNEIESRNNSSIYSTSKRKNAADVCAEETYQNLNSTEQPLINKISEPKPGNNNPNLVHNKSIKPNEPINEVTAPAAAKGSVGSIAKKFNVPGKPKPVIAAKPSVANSLVQKQTANDQSSQKDSIKTAAKTTRWNSKPTINTTSNVRSLHKRFENSNS